MMQITELAIKFQCQAKKNWLQKSSFYGNVKVHMSSKMNLFFFFPNLKVISYHPTCC